MSTVPVPTLSSHNAQELLAAHFIACLCVCERTGLCGHVCTSAQSCADVRVHRRVQTCVYEHMAGEWWPRPMEGPEGVLRRHQELRTTSVMMFEMHLGIRVIHRGVRWLHLFCQREANNRVNVRERPRTRRSPGCRRARPPPRAGTFSGWSPAGSEAWACWAGSTPGLDGLAQEGPARGPACSARRWFWDRSPTPHAASAGRPSVDPQPPGGRAPPRR